MDDTKLASYRAGLAEVEEALLENPDNADLLKVREDLKELLSLHEDQLDFEPANEEPEDAPELAGRTCVISSTFQYATISRVTARDPTTHLPTKLSVILFGDNEEAEVDSSELRLLGPYDAQAIEIGSEMQALYMDGTWYNCTAKSKAKNGAVLVSYDDYNEEEEIPLDRIRSRSWNPEKKKSTIGVKKDAAAKKYITTPGGYTIPTSLLVKPGDSALTREKKRKALEKLKREAKAAQVNQAYEERQNNWRDHVAKAQAKFRTQMIFTRRKH